MSGRVLVLAAPFVRHEPEASQPLADAGVQVVHGPLDHLLEPHELIEVLDGFHAVVASNEPYDERVFGALPRLRMVARWGVGYDSIDLQAATEAGVIVTNTPGKVTQSVADQTLCIMLALLRRLPEQLEVARSLDWRNVEGTELWHKTLGIVGLGSIGRAVAERARGFTMRVVACDPREAEVAWEAGRLGVELVGLEELLAEADIVTLHANLTDESRGLIGEDELRAMKPTAFLINCGRGGLCDQAALARALEEGWIAGAALDTLEEEPPAADDAILEAPNTIITPHNSSMTAESAARVNATVCDNILAALAGRRPRFVVNERVFVEGPRPPVAEG
ncbi:MAG: phosphoglycerate dehydrogenase [Armatimonadota bacterium]|nr:phosphoglycerate dehydrogenase [Armatimonadota bacterium]